MRAAITIVYNGLHHLQHGGFKDRMLDLFDEWIVVDGRAGNTGSTYWCNALDKLPNESDDGTIEFLKDHNITVVQNDGKCWQNKDHQFNAGVDRLREISQSGYLWQVDVDEWWERSQIEQNEKAIRHNVGACCFRHIVGRNNDGVLIAKGQWGSAAVNRVWKWKGEHFRSHEPAIMHNQKKANVLPHKFDHYSYYFDKDVIFKQQYYNGYEGIYDNWKAMQTYPEKAFPVPISRVFGRKTRIGRTHTTIYRFMRWQKEGMLIQPYEGLHSETNL